MLRSYRRYADAILAQLPSNRLLALDMMRGLAITAMILVNNPGSWSYTYAPLQHAQWHGWTITDLIFPFFIIIVGFSLQLSLSQQLLADRAQLLRKAVTRSLKLFGLGLFLALFYYNFRDPNFDYVQQRLLTVRWLGVLQRIALVYCALMLIVLFCRTQGRVLWLLGLCVLYLCGMWFMPYQDAFGNSFSGLWQFGNNFAAWLDHSLLGREHLYYRQATPFAFDAEGLWSTLPAIASGLSGVLLAQWWQSSRDLVHKIRGLFLFGAVAVWLAQLWQFSVPINKNLWTPSFVLLSNGYFALLMGAALWLTEIKQWRRWCAPLVVFGANAILFFLLAGVAARLLLMLTVADTSLQHWLFGAFFQPLLGNFNGSLAYALCFLLLSYVLMHFCYKRGYIFKV